MGINQQHAGAGDGPTTIYYRFPFAGGGDLITLIYLLALFRFSLLFQGWIPEARLRESVPVAS